MVTVALAPGASTFGLGGALVPLQLLGNAWTAGRVVTGPGNGVMQTSKEWERIAPRESVTLNVTSPLGTVNSAFAGLSETTFGCVAVESLKVYVIGTPAVTVTTVPVAEVVVGGGGGSGNGSLLRGARPPPKVAVAVTAL